VLVTRNARDFQTARTLYEEALPLVLDLEADRMAAPAITEENLRNQIDVVKEEIRVNVLNRPYGAFPWLQLPQIAFESFANTHDGYGSFVDLESSTVEDAADFFATYYAPGNAVLCIGGDLDVGETETLVRRWFGPVDARPVPPTPSTGEPSPTTRRSGVVEDPLAPAPAAPAPAAPAPAAPELAAVALEPAPAE